MAPARFLTAVAVRLANAAGGLLGQPLDGMLLRPAAPFAATSPPPRPDYARPETWASRPEAPGYAIDVPSGIEPAAAEAAADVFFVHPTTYLSGAAWNARWDEPGSARTIVDLAMRNQAGVFNGCCRIFAPLYRQASAIAFATPDARDAALHLAYSDVRAAFDHFLAHDDTGRALILAGHSQGSIHLIRLLQERFAGQPLRTRLAAAYVVGATLPRSVERTGLPISRSATDVGALITWNSVASVAVPLTRLPAWLDGGYRDVGDADSACTNPLSWADQGDAAAETNAGALPGVPLDAPLPPLVPALTGARCRKGQVVVAPTRNVAGFRDALTRIGGYHLYDYNLFYASIRRNVRARLAAFGGAGG